MEPGTYRHYKGGLYEVLGVAQHSETEERLVVYRALYGEHGLWVRPLAMFEEMVRVGDREVPRFAPALDVGGSSGHEPHSRRDGGGMAEGSRAPSVPTETGGAAEAVLGIIAAPGKPAELVASLREAVGAELKARMPGVSWRLEIVEDSLVGPLTPGTELVARAREELLDRDWDLAVCLTDLPLRIARRPVVAHVSPVHMVAVLSVPALGAVGLHRKAEDEVMRLIDALLGETGDAAGRDREARRRRMTRRTRDLARDLAEDGERAGLVLTSRLLVGDLRLLAGMVGANRPWRLAARLSRALTGAFATGVLVLVTSDTWRLGTSLDAVRLTLIAVASVSAISATLIVGAGLREHVRHRGMRHQVALFNLATTITVAIGVCTLYAALFVLALLAAVLFITPDVLADVVGHRPGVADYLGLAWLAASLATLGGALGAGLETDEAVKEAAYTHRAGGQRLRPAH